MILEITTNYFAYQVVWTFKPCDYLTAFTYDHIRNVFFLFYLPNCDGPNN